MRLPDNWEQGLKEFIEQDIDGQRWFEERLRDVINGTLVLNKFTAPDIVLAEELQTLVNEAYSEGYQDCKDDAERAVSELIPE